MQEWPGQLACRLSGIVRGIKVQTHFIIANARACSEWERGAKAGEVVICTMYTHGVAHLFCACEQGAEASKHGTARHGPTPAPRGRFCGGSP